MAHVLPVCVLSVLTSCVGRGKEESVTINNDRNRLSPEEIDRMIREAEKFAEEVSRLSAHSLAKGTYQYSAGSIPAPENRVAQCALRAGIRYENPIL